MIILKESLPTFKNCAGSVIGRSKYGVGKYIGGKIYVYKNYATDIIPSSIYEDTLKLLESYEPGFPFNTIMVDLTDIEKVRFDESADFDTNREPCPGRQISVDTLHNTIFKDRTEKQIFHHKWLWVKDSYSGFNVQESYDWSKLWTQYISSPSGFRHVWWNQLIKVGLEEYSGVY